jgi:hypothetical protein
MNHFDNKNKSYFFDKNGRQKYSYLVVNHFKKGAD